VRRVTVLSAFLMVALTASSWLFLAPVFTAPDAWCALWLLVCAGVLGLLAGLGRGGGEPFALRYLAAIPLLLVGAWLMPVSLSLGALVLAGTLALGGLSRLQKRFTAPLGGLCVFASILVLQGLALGPALRVASRRPAVGWLSGLLAWILNVLGTEAAAAGGSVSIVTVRAVRRFPVSLELLGFPVALFVLIGAIVVVLTLLNPKRRLVGVVTVLVTWTVYLVLRSAAMLMLFEQLQLYVGYDAKTLRVDILWNAWWQLATFLPLALFWGVYARPSRTEDLPAPALTRYRPVPHTVALVLALLGVGLVVFGACYHEVGTPRAKRLLIDEVHSDWEKTTRAPGTRWYGTLSMYNMFSLADYLEYHYDVVRWTGDEKQGEKKTLTDAVLAEVDVLILKTPTAPYAKEEREAVVRFVARGGGLFMIGEHTNYVGSAVQLNTIGKPLGVWFREDGLFSLTGKSPYVCVWRRPELLYHPIVASIPQFRFEVACSATGVLSRTNAVMLSGGLYQREADYHMENYYPFPAKVTGMNIGAFSAFSARDFGKGRVAAFGDSTTLSNFSAFYPGRAELVLATVDWLGRSHSEGGWRCFVCVPGALLAISAVVMFLRLPDRIGSTALFATAVFAAAALALGLVRTSVRRNFELPPPKVKPVTVGFVRENCGCELPLTDFVNDRDRSYDLFTQWVLRLRYFPRVRRRLEDARDDDLIVLIDPLAPPTDGSPGQRVADCRSYLDSGGTVLVILRTPPAWFSQNAFLRLLNEPLMLARSASSAVAAESLLSPFGIEVPEDERCLRLPLLSADGRITGVVGDSLVVKGGKTLYTMGGKPVAAMQQVGDGTLVVIGFGSVFRDQGMGVTHSTLPNAQLGARYALFYRLLQELLPPEQHLPEEVAEEVKADMKR